MKAIDLSAVAVTDDPIEQHILRTLIKAQRRNQKLSKYLAKEGVKNNLKPLDEWKSNDFYNYFCKLFREYYKKDYRLAGSLARASQRIEAFMRTNKLSNKEYKRFMDVAFSRFFKTSNAPSVGNIINSNLLELILGKKDMRSATPKDLLDLELRIEKETEEVEEYLSSNGSERIQGDFDAALAEAGIVSVDFDLLEKSNGYLQKA